MLKDVPLQYRKESFIAMDPPGHDERRKIVSPIVAPPNLAKMSSTIRERAVRILKNLPRGEVFDWADPDLLRPREEADARIRSTAGVEGALSPPTRPSKHDRA